MDDAAFGLNECQRVYYAAGIRHILRASDRHVSRENELSSSPPDLPEPYRKVLAGAVSGCATLWTYAQLGADLMGQGTPERSALVKHLVQSLAWPKGSIGFWPYTLWAEGSLTPRPDIFLFGVQHIRPKSIIVFGREHFTRNVETHGPLRDWLGSCGIAVLWLEDIALLSGRDDASEHVVNQLQAHKRSLA